MKTKKNFGAWMLDIFAAVMVTLFPTLCVKKYTKKSNKNAKKFLPGGKKELKAIEKLNFSEAELAARVWSLETRMSLLQKGNYALVSDVSTLEELDYVVEHTPNTVIIKALKVYTPTRSFMMKKLLKLSEQRLASVARGISSAFSSLKAWEILGVGQKEPYKGEFWGVASALITAAPEVWSVPFMREVNKIAPSQRNQNALAVWNQGFEAAFKLKLDMSKLIVVMCVLDKEKYQRICQHYDKCKDFSPYFEVMFPQLVKELDDTSFDLLKDNVDDVFEDSEETNWKKEAFRWLHMGYFLMGNERICRVILDNLPQIKAKVAPSVAESLYVRIANKASEASNLHEAHRLLPAEYRPELFERMVELVTESKDSKYLLPYFPFAGQSKKLAARAILTLVRAKEFPVERLSELKENLQTVAIEEMECLSQIEALRTGEESAITDLLTTTKLYPLAECYLVDDFEHTCSVSKYGENFLLYNEHFKLSDVAFKSMLHVRGYVSREDFVLPYAKKWGISKDLYYSLLGSNFSKVAPYVKKYIIAGGETAEQTEKTADETQVEVSEN